MIVTMWELVHREHGHRILRHSESGEYLVRVEGPLAGLATDDVGVVARDLWSERDARNLLDAHLGVDTEEY